MRAPTITMGTLAATTLFAVGLSVGCPTAAADDYGYLPINPNDVTDSTAYTSAAPVLNPNGQPGVETVFTHRDGSRQITDTILVLPDPAAAAAALASAKAALGETVTGATGPAAVGVDGTLVSGSSPNGSESVAVLMFTQGNAFATLEFEGPGNDPVPVDLAIELGQAQDTAIKDRLPA